VHDWRVAYNKKQQNALEQITSWNNLEEEASDYRDLSSTLAVHSRRITKATACGDALLGMPLSTWTFPFSPWWWTLGPLRSLQVLAHIVGVMASHLTLCVLL
jgi:hypothetical protein